MKIATIALAAAMLPAWAQEIKLPVNLDALADKADNAVTVTMDKSMLQFAAKFIDDKDDHDADVRKLVAGLEGIYVRSFEFRHEGEYSMADVEAVRSQLQSPPWGRLVGVRSKHGENVDVYFKDGGSGKLGGIVVIAAEPRELTIVNIIGTLDPQRLADLGGEFGIPRFERSGAWREAR
ncbi:MAG TPA: DUF4252 domain-containing protein [Bryobacteraceae bacterium]|jgi:hypothetical protein|nr:DUF4252 domain-containing protein [Bryobacteraceae bacterium]